MSFFSRLNRPATIPHPVGDGTAPIYEEFVEDGHRVLKETGRDNLFDYVQASKDDCDIYNIIARYQRGDVNVLARRQGQFLDVVGLPTNMAEAHQLMIDVERKFNALDPEIRKKFDNSVDVFVDKVVHSDEAGLRDLFGIPVDNNDVKDGDSDVA